MDVGSSFVEGILERERERLEERTLSIKKLLDMPWFQSQKTLVLLRVVSFTHRIDKRGEGYTDMVLTDDVQEVKAKAWGKTFHLEEGKISSFSVKVKSFRDQPYFEVDMIYNERGMNQDIFQFTTQRS